MPFMRRRRLIRASMPRRSNIYINDDYSGLSDISHCIHSLPKKYKDVLILKYVYGFTSKETARILSIKESTVRSNIRRGKVLLEQKLKENGINI